MVSQPGKLGPLIRHYRDSRGITQRELAAEAGVSLGALRDLEQGRTKYPRREMVADIAGALHLSQGERSELAGSWRAGQDRASQDRASQDRASQDGASQQWASQDREAPADGTVRAARGIRIMVLGPITAWRDDEFVALGPARQRAVLGLLAVHQGASVRRNVIIDALWPAGQPGAMAHLQTYVSRLRQALGARRGSAYRCELITRSGATYRLETDGDWLDVADFTRSTRQAAQAMSGGRPHEACRLYEHALALWHGDVLADIDLLRDYPAVTELAHQRADAVIGFAQAALGARTPQAALPRLRELCSLDPYNEAAHAVLMILLASAGQQAAALQAFTTLRRRLIDELGITPGPAVRQAHEQILAQRLPA
jgi:DNA-binding SARP family transcriptional activator/DNA-binding XRE family transcriptional regulator